MTLLGPITGGRHGRPYAAAVRDVGAELYLEEEFFLEGDATPYELPIGRSFTDDGRWRVVEDDARPFRTRLLVRRPFDPAHFNGCVIVVWNELVDGREVLGWETDESLNGCAWAFVSASRAGLHGTAGAGGAPGDVAGAGGGLVAWDPERYGTRSVDHDDLAYDLFTQAAEAVGPHRAPADRPGDVDPLGGLDVQYVIAAGTGSAAARIATYRNAVQTRTEAFDAFLLDRWFGIAAPLGDDPTDLLVDQPPPAEGRHRLRDDLDVPTLVCNTECEAPAFAHLATPDDDMLRVWEIAGGAHDTWFDRRARAAQVRRDHGAAAGAGDPADEDRPGAHRSDLDTRPARDAALRTLCEWVRTGEAPPVQPRLSIDPRTGAVERDEWGNALGGVRLPELEVPLARYRGRNDGPGAAALGGAVEAFTLAEVRTRYPDRATYVARYERAARAAHRAGVLLPRERDQMVAVARRRDLW